MNQLTENEKKRRKQFGIAGLALMLPVAEGIAEAVIESNGGDAPLVISYFSETVYGLVGAYVGTGKAMMPSGPEADHKAKISHGVVGGVIGAGIGAGVAYTVKMGAKYLTKLVI